MLAGYAKGLTETHSPVISLPGSRSMRYAMGITIVFGFVCIVLISWAYFHGAVMVQDEGMLLAYPGLVLRGKVQNLDFEYIYGPASLWTLAAAFKAFGTSVMTERFVGLIYRLLLAAGVYEFVRGGAGRGAALAAAFTCAILAIPEGLQAYAWFAGLACIVWSLAVLARASTERAPFFWAGVLGGLAVLYRQDFVLPVALSSATWFAVQGRRHWRWFAVGVLLGVAPYGLLIAHAGFAAVWNGLFIDPVFRVRPRRWLPLPTLTSSVGRLLLATIVSSVGVTALAAWRLYRSRSRPGAARMLIGGAFAVGLLHQALQRADIVHVLQAACAGIPFAYLVLGDWPSVGEILQTRDRRRVLVTATFVLAVVVVAVTSVMVPIGGAILAPFGVGARQTSFVTRGERGVPMSRQSAADLSEFLRAIEPEVQPGRRLLVAPTDLARTVNGAPFVYFLFPELEPATYFLEMSPGSVNRKGTRFAKDLSTADLVILTDRYAQWNEPNRSREMGDVAAMRMLESRFCPTVHVGEWTLFKPCTRRGP